MDGSRGGKVSQEQELIVRAWAIAGLVTVAGIWRPIRSLAKWEKQVSRSLVTERRSNGKGIVQ